jgi:L,D-transpeptidase YcbB
MTKSTAQGRPITVPAALLLASICLLWPASPVLAQNAAPVAAIEPPAAPVEPPAAGNAVAPVGFAQVIARRLEVEQKTVAGQNIDLDRLRRFYAARNFAPLWLGEPQGATPALFTAAAAATARTLQNAAAEGLHPQSYHADRVTALAAADDGDSFEAAVDRRSALELLLTDGLLRYARDVRMGRLPPKKISADLDVTPPAIDAAEAVLSIAAAADPAAVLADLAPKNPDYLHLRRVLADLRRVERNGGWPVVPAFKGKNKLEPGASDPALPVLRERLAASGDYTGPRAATKVYDAPLRAAVVRFQTRHGLEPDGALGPAALAEINSPIDARIAQVTANMERARWLPDTLGDRYVKVNIPEFKLTAVDGGVAVRSMRVIVGTKQRKTPMLSSVITTVILNPTWTMPPKLAKEDYLPKLQKNPGYLAEHGFSVYANWDAKAKPLNVHKINWKSYSPAAMSHLKLKQDPGPQNALGQIKFDIKNDFDVYLHDTPSRDKFQRTMRALSSGCVRLGEPMALADFVFAGMPDWGAEQRKPVLDSLKTRFVSLTRPTSVHILYQTAWADENGTVHFRPDIYERDAELLAAVARATPNLAQPIKTAMNSR